MSRNRTSWNHLPPEIRNNIISLLPLLGGKCSQLATVSRDWHSIIEPLNFAEISLTVPRLADLDSQAILFQKRSQIRYVWFRVELTQYDCTQCDTTYLSFRRLDNDFIADAFDTLFTTLSAWEPRGDLILDISVYSPSDNQHWFKHLSFRSDSSLDERPSPRGHEQDTTPINDPAHGWVAGRQVVTPSWRAIEQTFEEIMIEGPFDDDQLEMHWWRSLPLVPVVGVVLLRQQTRRRWKPVALANMLTRFPNMKELCYEPWREWDIFQTFTDIRKCLPNLTPERVKTAADRPEYRQPDADGVFFLDEIVQADDIRELQRVVPGTIFTAFHYQGAGLGREPETCQRQPAPHDAICLFHGRRWFLLRSASRSMEVGEAHVSGAHFEGPHSRCRPLGHQQHASRRRCRRAQDAET
ncbi:hypothetical protein MHUMG1_07539 [Metarhizium humberi]|uniref:F-box domain-containing protein n=1 Tax=Metarhizium humberi TaxID=2596975 RepID=A0A9P8M5Z5_9HYPO|nr:hypothetical protein MHUMG1_07539 [Metarhizium humberi]